MYFNNYIVCILSAYIQFLTGHYQGLYIEILNKIISKLLAQKLLWYYFNCLTLRRCRYNVTFIPVSAIKPGLVDLHGNPDPIRLCLGLFVLAFIILFSGHRSVNMVSQDRIFEEWASFAVLVVHLHESSPPITFGDGQN